MSKKILALVLALMMVMTIFAGCGGTDTPSTSEPAPAPSEGEAPGEEPAPAAERVPTGVAGTKPVSGLDFVACIASEPETIDPALNSSVDGATYFQYFFEGLMKFGSDGTATAVLTNGQAESYEISEDGLVYTFKLRDDIFWSDGVPVTAEDFVFGWQRVVDPETASPYNYIIDMVLNSKEIQAGEKDPSELGIVAVDEKTVQITLVSPCAYFLELAGFASLMPERRDVFEKYGDQWTQDPASYVTNGPYKMAEWQHDAAIKMVPNEYYYDLANLGPDSITWRLMDDQIAMYAAWQSGEIDFINEFPVDEITAIKDSGKLVTVPYLGTYCVVFQTEKAPFDNVLVRQALTLAIDRDFVCKEIKKTGELPADAWCPPGISDGTGKDFHQVARYYSAAPEDYAANCDKARELMAEAGYPDGAGFPAVEYLYNTSDAHQKIAEAVSEMWNTELKVSATLANQDWNVFLQTREDGEFEVARHGWISDYNDAASFIDMWTTGNLNNYAHWSNPEFDQLIADAIQEKDVAARTEILRKAEDLMFKDWVCAPIYFYTDSYVLNERVTNIYQSSLGYYFFQYAKLA